MSIGEFIRLIDRLDLANRLGDRKLVRECYDALQQAVPPELDWIEEACFELSLLTARELLGLSCPT